jgi:N-acetylmuramic acid 6-phosphate (MurNAc-6-P) etherase
MEAAAEFTHITRNTLALTEIGCRFSALEQLSAAQINNVFKENEHSCFLTMLNPTVLSQITTAANTILSMKESFGSVTFAGAGAGSSGRIFNAVARNFTAALKDKGIYLAARIAGGAVAFAQAVEKSEDDPNQFVPFLETAKEQSGSIYLLGVSCGASASCVMGGFKWVEDKRAESQSNNQFNAGLFCTNATYLAPQRAIENVDQHGARSFINRLLDYSWAEPPASLADNVSFNAVPETSEERFLRLINPLNVPDPVAGSSRLNGGTVTMIALEVLFECLLANDSANITPAAVKQIVERKHQAWHANRGRYSDAVESGIDYFAETLKNSGNVFYVTENYDTITSLDKSELRPTFGEENVFAFNNGGWRKVLEQNMDYLKDVDQLEKKSALDLKKADLSKLTENDLVIIVGDGVESGNFGAAKVHQIIKGDGASELEAKFILNAISTGGEAKFGRVITVAEQCYMCFFRISNLKLLERAVHMVKVLCKLSYDSALEAVALTVLGEDAPKSVENMPEHALKELKAQILSTSSDSSRAQSRFDVPRSILHGFGIKGAKADEVASDPNAFQDTINALK